jgi:hypothetical protein
MKPSWNRILFWLPRGLGLLLAAFISLFALDVFGAGYGFWGTIAALLIHLVPTSAVLVALVIAWRWEWMGAILFAGFGASYLIMAWGDVHWGAFLLISGPSFVIGALFLANWLGRVEGRSGG